jgi:hypothetical protein
MDKNKCPFFKRVRGVCEKGTLKTRCEHNALTTKILIENVTAYFLSVLLAKGFRRKLIYHRISQNGYNY